MADRQLASAPAWRRAIVARVSDDASACPDDGPMTRRGRRRMLTTTALALPLGLWLVAGMANLALADGASIGGAGGGDGGGDGGSLYGSSGDPGTTPAAGGGGGAGGARVDAGGSGGAGGSGASGGLAGAGEAPGFRMGSEIGGSGGNGTNGQAGQGGGGGGGGGGADGYNLGAAGNGGVGGNGGNGAFVGSIVSNPVVAGSGGGGGGGGVGTSAFVGVGGNGGNGGNGGVGVVLTSPTLTNNSTIQGGNGGNGGSGGLGSTIQGSNGNGGNGGIGVSVSGSNATFLNSGQVIGGNGGTSGNGGTNGTGTGGNGGVGVTGADLAIVNSGTITGGTGAGGQADAVLFTGGVNSFTITSTSTVNGYVVATGSGKDTFGLGGDTSPAAPFNLAQLGTVGANAQYLGFGILQKSGASTWTVTGAPQGGLPLAYQVTAGTLNLGSNQTANSLLMTGGTLAGDTLTVNNTTGGFNVQAGTISATLNGTGALTKTTAGTAILSGFQTYTGSTFVNGGTLEVDGLIISSTSTVNTGGTLSGVGAVASATIAAGGTLSPGNAANPYGMLTVKGAPLTFSAGSFYNVAITPTENSSTFVGGITTINGGTVNVTPGAGTYSPAMRYTILTSGGGVTGTFAGVTTTTPFAFLHPSLSYAANDVYLNIAPASPVVVTNPNTGQPIVNPVTGQPLTVPNYTTAASNQNQLHVAEGLTNAGIVGRGRGNVLRALNQLTVPQAQAAFNSLSGEGLTAAQNIANRSAELFTSSIFDQTTFYGSGNAANSITLTEPIHELADLPARATPPVFVQPNRTWRAWATGFGGVDDIHGNGQIGSSYQQATIYGGTLGVDYQLMPNYLVGVAIGGTNGDFLVPGRATSGSTTGGHVALYDLATFGSFYGASSTSFSYFGNRATRTVSGFGGLNIETERANFNSDEFRSRLEFGRHLAGYGGVITPFVALELAELRSNGFTESSVQGAGLFRLNVSGQSQASAPAFVGLRLQRATSLGNGITLSPTLQVAYVHEFAPYRSQIGTIADLPGSTFLVDGARPARNAAQVKAGAEMAIGAHSVIFANFDGEFSGVNQLHAGKGGFRYAW